jgi:hypothetical protein
VDYVRGVPPVFIDLEHMILHDRAHLIESRRLVMMSRLVKIAVAQGQQQK